MRSNPPQPRTEVPHGRQNHSPVQFLPDALRALHEGALSDALRRHGLRHHHIRAIALAEMAESRVRNPRHRREVKREPVLEPSEHGAEASASLEMREQRGGMQDFLLPDFALATLSIVLRGNP